jgi:hypothetical protein
MQALKEASSFGSIIVPKPQGAPSPAPTEAVVSRPEAGAVTKQETPSAQIVEFPKAA